ncbi:ribonuclease III [Desulfonema ishimotonii]|uniref:Ribonuclease 3 n=1 Tax=Desulfonema ishimotonii TaxID=45657 RepID=A0A401G0L9_9BACT|nr:ribonuclease III [Desulfonema ishimotonii]GBC62723.1 ribonuclease III [Desulfonema ishimotonii]
MTLSKLEKKLSYTFKNKKLLEEACRHSSYVNEHPEPGMRDNERLEFLGDAVLSLVVGHSLMRAYPDISEGNLSRMRAGLVNEFQLAELAQKLNLGSHLLLGKGEIHTRGREKSSILADAFEAVIAAIYLDGGFDAAFRFLRGRFGELIAAINAPAAHYDYKSQLQEIVQVSHKVMPVYTVVGEKGPDHNKTFTVEIRIRDMRAEGIGKSKKMAEQEAARRALDLLEKRPDV